jgi:predicted nucleotidyltransferase component of viral defense system
VKAYLINLCKKAETPLLAHHLVREYLQARILQSLQHAGTMQSLAFHRGTALRFLYQIPRYSEDLDFALEQNPDQYNFRDCLSHIERDFLAEAYSINFKISDKTAVHKAFVRFSGLLYELGLSAHKNEVIAVKLEIDTNPPGGAVLTSTSLKRHVALNLLHHDSSSLLAGKLHAVLQRSYPKGRDIFDLWWYLSQPKWAEPNLYMLNQALLQSGWAGQRIESNNWRKLIRERVEQLDWKEDVLRDAHAFLIDSAWEKTVDKDQLLRLLE